VILRRRTAEDEPRRPLAHHCRLIRAGCPLATERPCAQRVARKVALDQGAASGACAINNFNGKLISGAGDRNWFRKVLRQLQGTSRDRRRVCRGPSRTRVRCSR